MQRLLRYVYIAKLDYLAEGSEDQYIHFCILPLTCLNVRMVKALGIRSRINSVRPLMDAIAMSNYGRHIPLFDESIQPL